MNIFEEISILSCEQWVDSFPTEIPKHKFSYKHNKRMKEFLNANSNKHRQKSSIKVLKIFLIAAILFSMAVTALAITLYREFIVDKFSNHSEYDVIDNSHVKKVTSLEINYIPEGFVKIEEGDFYCVFKDGDREFIVEKEEINTTVSFDTEKYHSEIIEINGIKAVYYKSNNDYKGIVFNNGEYLFLVDGNIQKEQLVKIAQNVK